MSEGYQDFRVWQDQSVRQELPGRLVSLVLLVNRASLDPRELLVRPDPSDLQELRAHLERWEILVLLEHLGLKVHLGLQVRQVRQVRLAQMQLTLRSPLRLMPTSPHTLFHARPGLLNRPVYLYC